MSDQNNNAFIPPASPLNFEAPVVDIELSTMDGRRYRFNERADDILVIDFWSAECPVSQRYDAYFNGFAKAYGHKGVTFLAIDSNEYEDEEDIHRAIAARDITFPILRDTNNVIADYFDAVTTPHVYVFDRERRLRYRGAIDDSNFKDKEITRNYLEEAVDALLLEQDVVVRETEPFGCTINRVWAE